MTISDSLRTIVHLGAALAGAAAPRTIPRSAAVRKRRMAAVILPHGCGVPRMKYARRSGSWQQNPFVRHALSPLRLLRLGCGLHRDQHRIGPRDVELIADFQIGERF